MEQTTTNASEMGRHMDEAIESLRWCRQHVQDRGVTQRLRQLQITLSALALALDYEMDGQTNKAQLALDHADWRVPPKSVSKPSYDVHW